MKLRHNIFFEIIFNSMLASIVHINKLKASEISHTNYLSLNSNAYLSSYENVFNQMSSSLNRHQDNGQILTPRINGLSKSLLNDSYVNIYGNDDILNFENFTTDSLNIDANYILRVKLFTKTFLCE